MLADMTNFPGPNEACLPTGEMYFDAAARAFLELGQRDRVHARYAQAMEAGVSRYSNDRSFVIVDRHRDRPFDLMAWPTTPL